MSSSPSTFRPSERLQRAAQAAQLALPAARPMNAFHDLSLRLQWEQFLAGAAQRLDLEMVKELLKPMEEGGMGLRADAKDKHGTPALVLACGSDDPPQDVLPVVEALLDAGADINAVNESVNDEHSSALMEAAVADNAPLMRLLVERGADLDHRDSENHNVLIAAIFSLPQTLEATVEILKERLGDKGYVEYARTSDCGALHAATRFGRLESMNILVASGVGVDLVNGRGQRPLEVAGVACYSKESAIGMSHLLEMGPEIRPRSWKPRPPQHASDSWGWASPQAMWLLMLHETTDRWPPFKAEDAGFEPGTPVTPLAAAMHLGQPNVLVKMVNEAEDVRQIQREAMAISAAALTGKHNSRVADSFAMIGAALAGRVLRDVASQRVHQPMAA